MQRSDEGEDEKGYISDSEVEDLELDISNSYITHDDSDDESMNDEDGSPNGRIIIRITDLNFLRRDFFFFT